MATLSVIMIVKDEAHCLSDCLQSVRPIADELVIADTGSQDHTPDIIQAFGARFLRIPWENDFAAARNKVLREARGDWLLHMDADEVLDAAGAARIRGLVDADGEGADAVEVVLANYCNTPRAWRWVGVPPGDPHTRGYAGYLRTTLLRLFRNGLGFEYREPVHENISASVLERGGRIRAEEIIIHHYGYAGDETRVKEKGFRYLEIARLKRDRHPEDAKAVMDFAEQAFACGLSEDAEAACRDALLRQPDLFSATMLLSNLLLIRGALHEAEQLLQKLECDGHAHAHVATALAAIACRTDRVEDARARLDAVLGRDPNHLMALSWRARVHDMLGDREAAARDLHHAKAQAPGLEEFDKRIQAMAFRQQGEAACAVGAWHEALRYFVLGMQNDPEDPCLQNNLGVVLTHLGERDRAASAFKRALQLAPGFLEARDNLRTLECS